MMNPIDMAEIKNKVIEKRKWGVSLKELASELRLPISTVQGWIRGLPLSNEAIIRIHSKAKQARILSLQKRRIALPAPVYSGSFSPSSVRFLAHCLFDGSIFHDHVVYYSSHLSLSKQFAADGQRLFTLQPKRRHTKENVYRVYFYPKNLVDFLLSRKSFLLETVVWMGKAEQLEFLKAFFDDEGSVGFRPEVGKRVVRGYQKDIKTLLLIGQLLKGFGIDSRLENLSYSPEIVISGRKNIEKYYHFISFSKGVTFLAKRINSYYDQPVEKRVILEQLLSSYR
jgi:hypothetical protein